MFGAAGYVDNGGRENGEGEMMKDRQLAWARANGIPAHALEERDGAPSWVLKPEHQRLNLYQQAWWDFIAGREHRWARALNSSQCFAVNLFAPLKETPGIAWRALNVLLPERRLRADDTIGVEFEYLEPDAGGWLGEQRQATQIDVYFRVERDGRCLGHVVIEAKFTEPTFGSCRGWSDSETVPGANEDQSKCLDLARILENPRMECWLARTEGRHYWDLMTMGDSQIRLKAESKPCPFRRGLYQLMRNRVLADELRRHTGAAWAEVAVCRHPDNKKILEMKDDVLGTTNPISAFRAISGPDAVRDWPADEVLAAIIATEPSLAAWGAWMRRRYFEI